MWAIMDVIGSWHRAVPLFLACSIVSLWLRPVFCPTLAEPLEILNESPAIFNVAVDKNLLRLEAVMAGLGVFNVVFGINETKLTQSLEQRRYPEAEQIILQNRNASYLDEGCYQRTPLYIVLCGITQDEENRAPQHLYLARLLAQHGANVNYRVPATNYGSEYMGPGKSSVELIVEFFNQITYQPCGFDSDPTKWLTSQWDPWTQKVLGLDKQLVTNYETCLEQLTSLLLTMLAHGGDPNVTDEYRMTTLHRTAVFSRDDRMLEILCESGANVNAQDTHGNSPVGALCDAFPLGIHQFLDDNPLSDPYSHGRHLVGKRHFLTYLLQQKGIKLDLQNKLGRTALFNSMVRGDIDSAFQLLIHGCDPTLRGQVSEGHRQNREISPLYGGLCSLRAIPRHVEHYLAHVPRSYQFMAHLVDRGFFTRSEITSELHEYIDRDFPEFQHLKLFGSELNHLMFGGTSATLRQLCTRSIFTRYVTQRYVLDPECIIDNCGEYFSDLLDCSSIEMLVQELCLPRNATLHFDIELLRLLLCSKFGQFRWFKFYDEEIDGLFGEFSDSDEMGSEENDSDLEYW